MAVGRKSPAGPKEVASKYAAKSLDVANAGVITGGSLAEAAHNPLSDADGPPTSRSRRVRQGIAQFPMQILVPEETRNALRQRSEDTGASIRHIILRSLAADGFPVPRLTRRRS